MFLFFRIWRKLTTKTQELHTVVFASKKSQMVCANLGRIVCCGILTRDTKRLINNSKINILVCFSRELFSDFRKNQQTHGADLPIQSHQVLPFWSVVSCSSRSRKHPWATCRAAKRSILNPFGFSNVNVTCSGMTALSLEPVLTPENPSSSSHVALPHLVKGTPGKCLETPCATESSWVHCLCREGQREARCVHNQKRNRLRLLHGELISRCNKRWVLGVGSVLRVRDRYASSCELCLAFFDAQWKDKMCKSTVFMNCKLSGPMCASMRDNWKQSSPNKVSGKLFQLRTLLHLGIRTRGLRLSVTTRQNQAHVHLDVPLTQTWTHDFTRDCQSCLLWILQNFWMKTIGFGSSSHNKKTANVGTIGPVTASSLYPRCQPDPSQAQPWRTYSIHCPSENGLHAQATCTLWCCGEAEKDM